MYRGSLTKELYDSAFDPLKKREPSRYIIVTASTFQGLETYVNAATKQDYMPIGAVTFVHNGHGCTSAFYMQGMFR